MDPQGRQTVTAGNPESASSAIALDDEAARDISSEVLRLVHAGFDPRGGRLPVQSPGRAFVVEVLRLARRHGVDLSEADLTELFEAALNLEVADQTAAWLGDTLGDWMRGSFDTGGSVLVRHRIVATDR